MFRIQEHDDASKALLKLLFAVHQGRSDRTCLSLWSDFIRTRDKKCLICGEINKLHAHHIVRKTTYPHGMFQPGNGISLCSTNCHREVHVGFNGRPNLQLPLGAQGADDQDDYIFMFYTLLKNAEPQSHDLEVLYFIDDRMLEFFMRVQGYRHLWNAVCHGQLSRLEMAYQIWAHAPERVITQLINANLLE